MHTNLADAALKFLGKQRILPLLDLTSGGEFPLFFSALSAVSGGVSEALTSSGFSPVTPPPSLTHTHPAERFHQHYHIARLQSAGKRHDTGSCVHCGIMGQHHSWFLSHRHRLKTFTVQTADALGSNLSPFVLFAC